MEKTLFPLWVLNFCSLTWWPTSESSVVCHPLGDQEAALLSSDSMCQLEICGSDTFYGSCPFSISQEKESFSA